MADNLGWDEAVPPVTESAGLGAARMLSIKTSVRQVIDTEHVFSSSGGNGQGVHRLGSARAYVGTQSAVSSAGTDGRLMVTSDTSRLFHVGSGGTSLLGGATSILATAFPGAVPQRHYWAEDFGLGVTSSSGSTVVTFSSAYSGSPYVWVTERVTSAISTPAIYSTMSVDGATCFVRAVNRADGSLYSGGEFVWRSLGTRAL